MSLILDALKKLDREKASLRDGRPNIAAEILKSNLPRPGNRILLYLAAVSLTAVATAAITSGVIVGLGFFSKSSPPAPVNPPAPSQQVASASPSREPVRDAREETGRMPLKTQNRTERKKPATSSAPISPGPAHAKPSSQQVASAPPPREPVADARDEVSRVPLKTQNQTEGKMSASPPSEKKASQNIIPGEAGAASEVTKKPADPAPSVSATAPPLLKLSGIVWNEEPSMRRAVINGTFTVEGSVIEGVKVVEIGPTGVRLSYNGRPFELFMFH